jgi:hypothetical protein
MSIVEGPVVEAAAKLFGPEVTAWPQPDGVPRAVMVPVAPVALAIAFPLAATHVFVTGIIHIRRAMRNSSYLANVRALRSLQVIGSEMLPNIPDGTGVLFRSEMMC